MSEIRGQPSLVGLEEEGADEIEIEAEATDVAAMVSPRIQLLATSGVGGVVANPSTISSSDTQMAGVALALPSTPPK